MREEKCIRGFRGVVSNMKSAAVPVHTYCMRTTQLVLACFFEKKGGENTEPDKDELLEKHKATYLGCHYGIHDFHKTLSFCVMARCTKQPLIKSSLFMHHHAFIPFQRVRIESQSSLHVWYRAVTH
jgi:hypothetical protein